jgi:adhesin transport system membrane fusion protein
MNITKAHSHASGLLFVLLFIIVSFFVWASMSDIVQHVQGQGRVIPSGKTRSVQHLEGGIVREILVKESDSVVVGQELFVIDNINASTNRNEAQLKENELGIRLVRLRAEQDGYVAPRFSDELTRVYPQIVKAEMQLFQARAKEFENEIGVLDEQVKQKHLRLESSQEILRNLKSELNIALEQLNLNKKMFEAGSVSRSKYLDAQSRVSNFRTRIAQMSKEIPVIRAEKSEVQSKLVQAQQQNEAEIIEEINSVAFEQKQVVERLGNFNDRVSRTKVLAPVHGVVNARYIDTVGGVVQPGAIMADILPLEEKLLVEGQVSTEDRQKIYLGLPVKIRLSAYDFKRTGAVDGVLKQISADSFADQQGRHFYKIKVEIDAGALPAGVGIFSGMVVDLNVTVGRVSVLEAILRPFLSIKNQAFKKM